MFAGAALFASAISESGGIMYSLRGGYPGTWAQTAPALRLASRKTNTRTNFSILMSSPLPNCSPAVYYVVYYGPGAPQDTPALKNQLGKGWPTMTDVAADRTHGQCA